MLRIKQRQGSDQLLLLGVDMTVTALHSDLQRALQDSGLSAAALAGGVVVGSGVGVHAGDRLQVGDRQLGVSAVVDGAVAARLNGGKFAIAALPVVQQATGRTGSLDSILIVAQPDSDLAAVRANIAKVVNGHAIVGDPTFRAAQARGGFVVLQYTSLTAAAVSLVVAAFLIYNVMSMSISQRRRTFSMLRAIGATRRAIVTDLLVEALGLGLLGGVIGVVAGVIMGEIAMGQLPPAVIDTLESRLEYVMAPWSWVAAVLACTAASVLAAGLAARQVYRVSPIEALSDSVADVGDSPQLSRRVLVGAGSLVLIAATALLATADVGRYAMFAIGLALLGCIGVCFAASTELIRATAGLARALGPAGAVAAATIERSPRRMWATVMTVFIAVATTVAITGADDNVTDSIVDSYATVRGADLVISSAEAGVFPTVLLPADTESTVRSVPGVRKVLAGQGAYASLGDTKVLVQAVDPGMRNGLFEAAGAAVRAQVDAGKGIIVSQDVARSIAVSAGERLDLPTPTGVHQVTVLAVVPFFAGLTGAVGMNLNDLRSWFDRPGSTSFEVDVEANTNVARVDSILRQRLPQSVHTYTGWTGVDSIAASTRQLTALLGSIAWIVVVIAGVALLNTMMLSVLERRREIGVLRAIGSTIRLAVGTVVAEAVAIGLVGGALGLLAGCVNQYLIVTALANVLNVDVDYKLGGSIMGFGMLALALCMLGAIPPAVRVARLDILEAIGVG
ncbi:ABC transporter permease [Nocardia sp. NPDC101769]|uniref:ABC transporter permease n=1 Tax=Nocardia sp. NPDC101769 TaxID=3364333 RepID=UPI00380824F4